MKTLFPPDQPSFPDDSGARADFLGSLASSAESWRLIQLELQNHLDQQSYEKWVLPLKWQVKSRKRITLVLPDRAFYQKFVNHCLPLIEACKHALGLQELALEIELADANLLDDYAASAQGSTPPGPGSDAPPPLEEGFCYPAAEDEPLLRTPLPDMLQPDTGLGGTGAPSVESVSDDDRASTLFTTALSRTPKLNPNYTFENFVRGPSNQFALATCLNVAENPGQNYNPLFLYGSTGLGKTHLLHAVGNQVLKRRPDCIVTYISSERFMNEMIYCIRHNKMWDFRQKYRHCDVFMMDDIQFISGNKAATQEEFFHTFNTLYEAKKQIIITSDLFPQDIPDIEERLRNRFQWGLIADIQPPDVEHRIAILMNKAEKLNVQLNPEVAEFIANHAKRNVRELEGALHRIAAFAALQGRPLDKNVAMEIFHSIQGEAPKAMEIEVVQKTVAEHFKLRVADLKSKKRQRALTLPRQIAMYLSRQHTQASFPEIGEKFGGKDHTTVIHAVRKITKDKVKDLDLKAHLDTLERHLEQMH